MQSLEQIIRPFQSPSTLAKRRVISNSTKIASQDAIIEWGRSGAAPVPQKREENTTGIGFEVVKCDDNYFERGGERKFSVIRIENPEDPEQYIMYKRPNSISFDKKEPANEEMTYNNSSTSFATMPALDNTTYWQSNYDDEKCKSTYNFTYPTE